MPSSPTTNSGTLLPALPYSVAVIGGMVVAYFFPVVPLWLSLVVVAVSAIGGYLLLAHRTLRLYPPLVACLFVGLFCMTYAKEQATVTLPPNPTTLVGTVVDTPRATAKRTACIVYVQRGALTGRKVRIYLPKEALPYVRLAATYEMEGYLHPFTTFGESPHFNYTRWAESHALSAQMNVFAGHWHATDSLLEQLPFFERVAVKAKMVRAWLLHLLAAEEIGAETLSLVAAMAFGERSTLSTETWDMFARTGVSHLLALSGLHLSILYTLLAFILYRVVGRTASSSLLLLSIWLYVVLVGMPVSALRAATMLSFFTLFALAYREGAAVNTILCTVVAMLLVRPLMLWDMGFQLSVASVLSIAIFYRPLYALVDAHFLFRHIGVRWFWGLIVVSLSANIGAAPLAVYYFGRFTPYFFMSNIVAVPLVTLLLYCVVLTLVLWPLPLLRHAVAALLRGLTTALQSYLHAVDRLPYMNIDGIHISAVQLLLLYLMAAAVAVVLYRLVARLTERRRLREGI